MFGRWQHHSNLAGVAERYIDGEGGLVHRQKVQDIEPIVDMNRRVANHENGRTPGGGRKIASIPATIYYKWIVEWQQKGLIGPGNMEPVNDLIKQRLRDSDYSKFRSTWGSI